MSSYNFGGMERWTGQGQQGRSSMMQNIMPNTSNVMGRLSGQSSMTPGSGIAKPSSGGLGLGNPGGGGKSLVSSQAINASRSLNFGGGGGSSFKPSVIDKALGYTDPDSGMQVSGYAPMALGAAQGLGSMYMGMKQYGLAKDQLAESKRQFNKQYESNKRLTNERLSTRHERRLKEGHADQSTTEYMKKYGVK